MSERIDFSKFPFFSGLDAQKTGHLGDLFTSVHIEKRCQLRLPQNLDDAIFFVDTGRIKISYFSESGKELIVTILEPGDVYSFHSEASICALADSHIWRISMTSFRKIVMEFPSLNFRLYRALGSLLRDYNNLVLNLAHKEVSSRLASFLLKKQANGEWIQLGMTHEELSCRLGSTRQTITSCLNRWEKQGLIELKRGSVKIMNRKILEEFV